MTTEKKEWLSALADGELQGKARQDALDALLKDADLRRSWANYHAIREGLHGHSSLELGMRLHERVEQSLAQEPTVLAPRRFEIPQGWMRHAAGLAVAASVTAVAIIGIQSLNQGSGSPAPVQTLATQGASEDYDRIERPVSVANGGVRSDQLAPYLVNHNEYSGSTNMQGVLPYVRIVGHGSNQ